MSHIMNIGGAVVGEIYLLPPTPEGTKLMAKLYNGTEIELIDFRKPLETPARGSAIGRIEILEDDVEFLLSFFRGQQGDYLSELNSWLNSFRSVVESKFRTLGNRLDIDNFEDGLPTLTALNNLLSRVTNDADLSSKLSELTTFISSREGLLETDKQYLINNIELLTERR